MSSFSIAELEAVIDEYGADSGRWPATKLSAAQQLLDTSDAARDLLARAISLENALRGRAVKAPGALVDRITSAAASLPQQPDKPRR